jgi:hypothetical protein
MPSHPRCSVSSPRRRPAATTLAVASLLALVLPRPSAAAWQLDGVPLSPSPTALQSVSLRALAADGSSGAYTVWEFQETNPYDYTNQIALRAQRVDVLGNRPAPWVANGSTIRSWIDTAPSGTYSMMPIGLFENGSGGAVLAALDNVFVVEYQTLFRLYGVAPGGGVTAIFIANSSLGGYPVLAAGADGDGSGGAVMIGLQQTFAQPPNPPPPGALYAQRVNGAGAPLWPQDGGAPGVQLSAVGMGMPNGVAALSDGSGGGFFAWIDRREAGDPDVYAQHLDANGAIAADWPAGGVLVCGAAGDQSEPHLARAGAGGVIVVWRDDRSGDARLFGAVVLANGTLAAGIPADGRPIPSSDLYDTFLQLAGDGQGGCFVAREGPGGISRLHRLDPALLAVAGWPGDGVALNALAAPSGSVGLAPDGLGGTFVSFRNGFGSATPQGLHAQHLAADGTPAPGWAPGGYRLSGTGQGAAIVRSDVGAIVAWDDSRSAYRGVYAQRLVTDGPVATQLALARATANARGVSLRWYSADGPALRATIERSAGGAGWAFLADVTADGDGYLEYEDTSVTPGTRYGYRVVWQDGAVTRTGGEAWITVPRELALALEAPSPNPSHGAVALAVTLPDARGARLDVLDVAGRRVAGRDLTGLGAGRHVVTLREAEALGPGLYVVQLAQAGGMRRVRLVRVD